MDPEELKQLNEPTEKLYEIFNQVERQCNLSHENLVEEMDKILQKKNQQKFEEVTYNTNSPISTIFSLMEDNTKISILVLGRYGEGKSELINLLAGKYICEVSSNYKGTTSLSHGLKFVEKGSKEINIWDTEGHHEDPQIDLLRASHRMLIFIKKIDLIFWVQSGGNIKFDGYLCEEIPIYRSSFDVPVWVILTKMHPDDENDLIEEWKNNLQECSIYVEKIVPVGNYRRTPNKPVSKSQALLNNLNNLVTEIANFIKSKAEKEEKSLFIKSKAEKEENTSEISLFIEKEENTSEISLFIEKEEKSSEISLFIKSKAEKEEKSSKISLVVNEGDSKVVNLHPSVPEVDKTRADNMRNNSERDVIWERFKISLIPISVAVLAASGVGLSPIPFSDWFLLIPIQIAMMTGIVVSFKLQIGKGVLLDLLFSTISCIGGGLIGKLALSPLKLLPGINIPIIAIDSVFNGVWALATGLALSITLRGLLLNYRESFTNMAEDITEKIEKSFRDQFLNLFKKNPLELENVMEEELKIVTSYHDDEVKQIVNKNFSKHKENVEKKKEMEKYQHRKSEQLKCQNKDQVEKKVCDVCNDNNPELTFECRHKSICITCKEDIYNKRTLTFCDVCKMENPI